MKFVLDTWQSWLVATVGGCAFLGILGLIIVSVLKAVKKRDVKLKLPGGAEINMGDEDAPPEEQPPEEHECVRGEDFKQLSLVVKAMADLLSGIAQKLLDPTLPPEVVQRPAVGLEVRMGDYNRHLEAQGYVT